MLKNLPLANLSTSAKAKCGEIFCHSYKDFTIFCTFCDIKSFAYEDFLKHIQNVHFENNLLKTETINTDRNQYLQVNTKSGAMKTKDDRDVLWNKFEADDVGDDNSDSYEEETVTVLKKTQRSLVRHRKRKSKRKRDIESDEVNHHRSDEDFNSTSSEIETDRTTIDKNVNCDKSTTDGLPKLSTTPLKDEKSLLKSRKKEIEHPCPECEDIFPHLKYLDRHVFEYHNGYKCSLCDKRFRLRHHLRGHAKTHATEKCFTCTVEGCGRSFTDQEYLKRHLEVHTMDCTFICDFENCGKAFQTQRRLTIHTYTHRKPKKLVCDTCGYSCRANITLKIHQRVHTGEKPFGCEVCGKHFVSKTALTEHMLSHSNTRPHICKICNASFANPRVLQRHIFIHSDERKFKCKLCDSAFKQATGLDGHMRRLHRAPKPLTVISSRE